MRSISSSLYEPLEEQATDKVLRRKLFIDSLCCIQCFLVHGALNNRMLASFFVERLFLCWSFLFILASECVSVPLASCLSFLVCVSLAAMLYRDQPGAGPACPARPASLLLCFPPFRDLAIVFADLVLLVFDIRSRFLFVSSFNSDWLPFWPHIQSHLTFVSYPSTRTIRPS